MISEVADALAAWEKAPAHVRMMAGAYVGPLLSALVAVGDGAMKMNSLLIEVEARLQALEGDK